MWLLPSFLLANSVFSKLAQGAENQQHFLAWKSTKRGTAAPILFLLFHAIAKDTGALPDKNYGNLKEVKVLK